MTTTELTQYGNDGWDDTDNTDDRVIQGTLIKCVDGRWTDRDKRAIPPGTRLLALSTHQLLQRWQDSQPVETIHKRPGQPLPDVDELNAAIPQATMGKRSRRQAAPALAKAAPRLPARRHDRRAFHLHQFHSRRADRGRKSQGSREVDARDAWRGRVSGSRAFERDHEDQDWAPKFAPSFGSWRGGNWEMARVARPSIEPAAVPAIGKPVAPVIQPRTA